MQGRVSGKNQRNAAAIPALAIPSQSLGQQPPVTTPQTQPLSNFVANGSRTPSSPSSHAAAMLGRVGVTTEAVSQADRDAGRFSAAADAGTGEVGEDIFGPFEAGFGEAQDGNLERLGCSNPSDGYVDGGADTQTFQNIVTHNCDIVLPRWEGDRYVGILDECGGHTKDYHNHESLICLYDEAAAGHSTKVGEALDGGSIYGKFEDTDTLPKLDACSAHYGKTPDSTSASIYHYHVQDAPPFVVGCFGPNDDGSLVTVQQCRDFYTGCGDGDEQTFTTAEGTYEYDMWCPCFDKNGANIGTIEELEVFSTDGAITQQEPVKDEEEEKQDEEEEEEEDEEEEASTDASNSNGSSSSSSGGGGKKPNVVFFMPDDMHFLWDERAETPTAALAQHTALVPNMNKVREEGVVFTEAIVAGPKCAPSRFNVLTGRYCSRSYRAHSTGGAAVNGDAIRTSVDVPTCKLVDADLSSNLQTDMAAGGYETIMSGKWHLSAGTYANPYVDAEADVADAGFSNAASIYVSNMDSSGLTTFGHNLEWVTAKAIEGIDSALKSSKPFFLYFTPTNPWGQNQGMNTASLQDFTVRDTPSGTLAADPVSGMPARSTVLERAPACSGGRNCVAGEPDDGWVGTIAVDDSLGSLMAHLKANGELDNTLIIVTQDHGQTAKESLYQGGVRVSLFARYPPAIRAGLVVNTPVTNIDVAPTILEFAGIAASFGIDGISWWEAAASAETPSASLRERECLISEMNYDRIVVCGSMKYLSNWDDGDVAKAGITNSFPAHADAEQIYNLASDPTEQTNLVSGGTQEAFRAKAIAILKKHDADTAAASAGSLTTGTTKTTTASTAIDGGTAGDGEEAGTIANNVENVDESDANNVENADESDANNVENADESDGSGGGGGSAAMNAGSICAFYWTVLAGLLLVVP